MSEQLAFIRKKGGGATYTETVLWTNPSPNANFPQTTVTLSDSMNNYTYLGLEFKYTTNSSDTMTYYMKVEDFSKQTTTSAGSMQVRFGGVGNITMSRYVVKTSDTSITIGNGAQVAGTSTSSTIGIPLYIYGINKLKQGTGFNETTLWTNSAPTSEYSGGNVTLSDNLSNYDYIKITVRVGTTNATSWSTLYSVDEFKTFAQNSTASGCGHMSGMNSANARRSRAVVYVDDTTVNFKVCYEDGSSTLKNTDIIPTAIIGCKLS